MTQPIDIYQVDAFARSAFGGNPAAVCPLSDWLPDDVMQSIASENNLSETAFIIPASGNDADYEIRWFTPAIEVDLCGHATLASGCVLFEKRGFEGETLRFKSRSGLLEVSREGDRFVLDFPSQPPRPAAFPDGIERALGVRPLEFLRADKNMAVLADETAVAAVTPDLAYIAALPGDGLIVTAEGEDCDFVSRYFAPHAGIDEDPVTGSAHCVLIPYWAARLDKSAMQARQISARVGDVSCRLQGDRVKIGGHATLFLEGTIHV